MGRGVKALFSLSLVAFCALAAWYALELREEVGGLRQEATALAQDLKAAAAAVDAMRQEQRATNAALSEWARGRAEIDALRRELDAAVLEAMTHDQSYADWRRTPLPDRLRSGLFDGLRVQD